MNVQDLLERFRENVALKMRERGLSQSDLAREMEVKRQHVWNYLNEKSPGLDVIAKFAEGLDVEPHELLLPIDTVATRRETAKAS